MFDSTDETLANDVMKSIANMTMHSSLIPANRPMLLHLTNLHRLREEKVYLDCLVMLAYDIGTGLKLKEMQ